MPLLNRLLMRRPLAPLARGVLVLSLAGSAFGQVFSNDGASIPSGNPFNNSFTENVDFGDCDLDGDWDAAWADGGDCCNDQNRLWINQGGLQGATLGMFADESATRLPAIVDTSRDIEFIDFDNDGDSDLFVTNTSQISNQTTRFWTNMGHAQGSSLGFYSDETAARFVGLGSSSSGSSVAPALVLAAGGFIDWSGDAAFADLDSDGALDLVQSSYGALTSSKVPTRLFLNDGTGTFHEYNPSGYQLPSTDLVDNAPALWASGLQQDKTTDATGQFADLTNFTKAVEIGDLDSDFDLEILVGNKFEPQRIFRNELDSAGLHPFTDVSVDWLPTGWIPGGGAYEEELADLDNDGDLDIYGINWGSVNCDAVMKNNGDGTMVGGSNQAGGCDRNHESDVLDYDADGDLDVVLASDVGQERVLVNQGPSSGGDLIYDPSILPFDNKASLAVDPCDVDGDGDFDLFVANDTGVANFYLKNLTQVADTWAPSVPSVEQAPDRNAGPAPTRVRAHVLDNEAWAIAAFDDVRLELSIDGGPFLYSWPMRWSGGEMFRGEIPGQLAGTLTYRVHATDGQGNGSVSATRTFQSTATCLAAPSLYCTAKASSIPGCVPTVAFNGSPSASAGAGFTVSAAPTPGKNFGLYLYTINGAAASAANTAFGFLCISTAGMKRIGAQNGGGTINTCTGAYGFDFNAYAASGLDPALVAGASVDTQVWYRDAANPGGANFTNAGSFDFCP